MLQSLIEQPRKEVSLQTGTDEKGKRSKRSLIPCKFNSLLGLYKNSEDKLYLQKIQETKGSP